MVDRSCDLSREIALLSPGRLWLSKLLVVNRRSVQAAYCHDGTALCCSWLTAGKSWMALVDYGSDNAAGIYQTNRQIGTTSKTGHSRIHKLTVQVTLLRKTARQSPRTATLTSPIAIGRANTMQHSTRSLEAGFWLSIPCLLHHTQDQLRISAFSCCDLFFARMDLHICSNTRMCRFLQSKGL